MTVSPGIFFFHIFKILTFCFVRGVKDKKWSKMTKNPVRCPPHPRNHISCDCQIWYTGKMIISPGIFFILSKCWFFGILGGGRGKRAKNGPNWQKIVSIALHISGAIHHMLVLQGTHLFVFFHFLKILIFWVHKGIKGQKNPKNCVTLHISGTIHHMIVNYGAHV